jgi:DNA transformation protein
MAQESFKDFVIDQLDGLPGLRCKGMFGGYGIYADEVFFAIVHDGAIYFKVDEVSVGEYVALDMGPFQPNAKQTLKSFYEVPPDILEDRGILHRWAEGAIACAIRHKR